MFWSVAMGQMEHSQGMTARLNTDHSVSPQVLAFDSSTVVVTFLKKMNNQNCWFSLCVFLSFCFV